jgi:hypothetical protein
LREAVLLRVCDEKHGIAKDVDNYSKDIEVKEVGRGKHTQPISVELSIKGWLDHVHVNAHHVFDEIALE